MVFEEEKVTFIAASRGSLLAVTQSKNFIDLFNSLESKTPAQLKTFITKGDTDQTTSLAKFGGTGIFVKELEIALSEKKADFAIHSLKDVPYQQPEELRLACFPKRISPFDSLLTLEGIDFHELKKGAVIGTSSPRRRLQLGLLRPDLVFKDLRGNIDTRIQKLKDQELDGIILAEAGLSRLELNHPRKNISLSDCIPAPGQGVLGIECRKDATTLLQILSRHSDPLTEKCIFLERTLMNILEVGCHFPFGAYAYAGEDNKIHFTFFIGNESTKKYLKKSITLSLDFHPDDFMDRCREYKKECLALAIL